MTEFTHLVNKAREQEAFARWTTQPKYLYMDSSDGILITKFNDGRIWYEDDGKSTYSFPPTTKKTPGGKDYNTVGVVVKVLYFPIIRT